MRSRSPRRVWYESVRSTSSSDGALQEYEGAKTKFPRIRLWNCMLHQVFPGTIETRRVSHRQRTRSQSGSHRDEHQGWTSQYQRESDEEACPKRSAQETMYDAGSFPRHLSKPCLKEIPLDVHYEDDHLLSHQQTCSHGANDYTEPPSHLQPLST